MNTPLIAQSGSSSTPYLNVSRVMGRVIAICLLMIVVVLVIKKLGGRK